MLSFLVIAFCLVAFGRPLRAIAEEATPSTRPSFSEGRARTVLDVMALGRDLLRKGQYGDAAIEFEKVLQIDPPNSAAARYLRLCEKKLEGQ
jgi:Flp pilus assembly protein TadD